MSRTRELSSDLVVYAVRLVRSVRRAQETPAAIRVLSLLDEHGPIGVTALAAADRCTQPTMSGLVGSLEDRGLVTRVPHPDDARSRLLSLTEAGRHELEEVRRVNGETVAARLAASGGHTEEELATAVAVLRDVLQAADPDDGRSSR